MGKDKKLSKNCCQVVWDWRRGCARVLNGDVQEGEAIQIFLNIASGYQRKEMEENLSSLLEGRRQSYEFQTEHGRLIADPDKTLICAFAGPAVPPIEGKYETKYVLTIIQRMFEAEAGREALRNFLSQQSCQE